MAIKQHVINFNSQTSHNSLSISPKIDGEVFVYRIFEISNSGKTTDIHSDGMAVTSEMTIRYGSRSSLGIGFVISHPYAESLSIDDLLSISIESYEFSGYGEISTEEGTITAGKYLNVISEIENKSSALINIRLSMSGYSKYGDRVLGGTVVLSQNEDGVIGVLLDVASQHTELPHLPEEDSISISVDGSEVNDFTVAENKVFVDIPDGSHGVLSFKPKADLGEYVELIQGLSMNGNSEIRIDNDRCHTIKYSMVIEVINLKKGKLGDTPVVKSIALVSGR